jgi:ATP-dependent RNA helicase DeaD
MSEEETIAAVKPTPEPFPTFDELDVPSPLLDAFKQFGIERPTPLQTEAWKAFQAEGDVLFTAYPGTGKTLAYLLPCLAAIDLEQRTTQVLVLVPGRERAQRVAEGFASFGVQLASESGERLSVMPLGGGPPDVVVTERLARGQQVLVATPEKLFEMLEAGKVELPDIHTLIVDEVDEALRGGQDEALAELLDGLAVSKRTWYLAGTFTEELLQWVLDGAENEPVRLAEAELDLEHVDVEPRFSQVPSHRKFETLVRQLEAEPEKIAMVFCGDVLAAEETARRLRSRGFTAEAYHTAMTKKRRTELSKRLEEGELDVLVATDAAAREARLPQVERVMQLSPPRDLMSYVHRLDHLVEGGDTVLIVTPRERPILYGIEQATGQRPEPIGAGASSADRPKRADRRPDGVEEGMVRLYLGIGRWGGVRPGDIVGAIANEAGVPGKEIGSIDIYDRFSFVELPEQYKEQVLDRMADGQIRGRRIEIRPATPRADGTFGGPREGAEREGAGRDGGRGGGRGGRGGQRERSGERALRGAARDGDGFDDAYDE